MTERLTATDRRYQVFISSTFTDLDDERKAAIEAVFERGHIPIALERFSPANETDLQVIKKAMFNSQVYLLILGHRYGQLIPDQDISFTEFEYDLAQEYELLTLVFLFDTTTVSERRKKLDPNNVRDNAELKNYERLTRFNHKITKHFRRIFTPGPHFKYLVEIALADNLANWDKPGFIREPSDPVVLEGAKNEFIGDIVAELRSFDKLYKRTKEHPDEKRGVARFFVQQYMDRLIHNRVSLFFESGSTVAFLAKEMSKDLSKAVTLTETGAPSIQISTNNVLAYLMLWLKARIPCTKFPWSPPVETTYGAAYGGLENLVERSPDYRLPPLDESAQREIKRLQETPFTLTSMKSPALLLGAASGLQLSSNHRLTFHEAGLTDSKKHDLEGQVYRCFGPHVGSYHNKVFKRFMYATRLPIVIFVTGEKIDCNIEVGKCHFILDSQITWLEFCKDHPLSFCVGCVSEEKPEYIKAFQAIGFDIIDENNASPISAFMARNSAFVRDFEAVLDGKV